MSKYNFHGFRPNETRLMIDYAYPDELRALQSNIIKCVKSFLKIRKIEGRKFKTYSVEGKIFLMRIL